ncbi:MAG TPA: IMS domain-containing protein [Oculatellaceae cyanobacterium]
MRVKSLQPLLSSRIWSTKIGMITISFLFASFSAPICTAAVAQNNDGTGMDQMFNDGDTKRSGNNAKSESTESDESKSSESEGGARSHSRILSVPRRRKPASAPLTSLEAFARSPIVQGTAWPGVGPFKPGEDNSLVDPNNASMRIDTTEQKQVTGVDLALSGRSARDFLTIEMTSDFLLEALGTKPARISDFNTALEKNRAAIFTKRSVASIPAGRYKVRILPNADDVQKLVVQVQNVETIAEAPAGSTKGASTDNSILAGIFNKIKPVAASSTEDETEKPSKSKGEKKQTPSSPASIKDTMRSLIENWQKVKCAAVKNRDTKQLSTCLTGHALSVQTKGVEWLAAHHQYIEMVPMTVTISKVDQDQTTKKYTVRATVKESSKTYDEQSNKLLREAEDTRLVLYTIEKQGDNYLISDSAIEKMATPQDAQKK